MGKSVDFFRKVVWSLVLLSGGVEEWRRVGLTSRGVAPGENAESPIFER